MFFLGKLSQSESFRDKLPMLADILAEVKKIIAKPFQEGAVYIMDGKVKINSERVEMVSPGLKPLEWHREFVDIHLPVSGPEILGWKPVDEIRNITARYDSAKDISFSDDCPQEFVKVSPGEFIIFHPSDAHAPCQGDGFLDKLCVKIPVSLFAEE